jgi:hypothetical protein
MLVIQPQLFLLLIVSKTLKNGLVSLSKLNRYLKIYATVLNQKTLSRLESLSENLILNREQNCEAMIQELINDLEHPTNLNAH